MISISSFGTKLQSTTDSQKDVEVSEWIIVPFDSEVILSRCKRCNNRDQALYHISLITSHLNIIFTKFLIEHIPTLFESITSFAQRFEKNPSNGKRADNKEFCPPRLADIADLTIMKVRLSVPSARISLEAEGDGLDLLKSDSTKWQDSLVNEILYDFLSHIACFALDLTPTEVKSCTAEIAIGRMCALGFSKNEAMTCVETSLQLFSEEMNILQRRTHLAELNQENNFPVEKELIQENISKQGGTSSRLSSYPLAASDLPKKSKSGDETVPDSDDPVQKVERVISFTVQKTTLYMSQKVGSRLRYLPWKEALILDLSSGFTFLFDQLTYDYKLCGKCESLMIRNGAGVNLLEVIYSDTHDNNSSLLQDNDIISLGNISRMGLFFSTIKKDYDEDFGNGGESLFKVAEDDIYEIGLKRRCRVETNFSTGSFKLFFAAKDATSAYIALARLLDSFNLDRNPNGGNAKKTTYKCCPVISRSIIGNITVCSIMLCSDELQPFTRLVFDDLVIDITKSIFLPEKQWLITAASRSILLFDLSPEGQFHHQVLGPVSADQPTTKSSFGKEDASFHMTLSLSSDSRMYPSELIIELSSLRFYLLRRYINELLQYFLGSEYGVGKFCSVFSSGPGHDQGTKPHPLYYQVSLSESSIILPTSSSSADFVAAKADSIVLTNSYHTQSWTCPNITNQEISEDSDDNNASPEYQFPSSEDMKNRPPFPECFGDKRDSHLNLPGDSKSEYYPRRSKFKSLSRTLAFDKSSLLRLNVSAEAVRIYTAISKARFDLDLQDVEASVSLMNFLKIRNVADGCLAFEATEPIPEGVRLDRESLLMDLKTRVWEEVTVEPVQIEALADLLPSHLRLLLKDHIAYTDEENDPNPFSLKLRMSQFYSLLSIWYGNMQELPLMFPYSESTLRKAKIPPCPTHWPEYGSENFVERMQTTTGKKFEMAVSFNEVIWSCEFDTPEYFPEEPVYAFMMQSSKKGNICLRAEKCVIRIDTDHDRVIRVGCGARVFSITDEERQISLEDKTVEIKGDLTSSVPVDLNWGLLWSRDTLMEKLPVPLQLSVFMTPDNWCLVNLAVQDADLRTADLTCIWILLEYFGCYFKHEAFGNPTLVAHEQNKISKPTRQRRESESERKENCLNMDFRLWLLRPHLVIPSSENFNKAKPFLILYSENGGTFYRYRSAGYNFRSQEVCSRNLDIIAVKDYYPPALKRGFRSSLGSDEVTKVLADSLNFSLKYDFELKTNHMNVSVCIPLYSNSTPEWQLIGIEPPDTQVQPFFLPEPKVCKPSLRPLRSMGQQLCDVTLSPGDLKLAVDMLGKFIGVSTESSLNDDKGKASTNNGDQESNTANGEDGGENPASYSISGYASGLRLFISDPALGVHLPKAVVCLPHVAVNISQLRNCDSDAPSAVLHDLQTSVDAHFWVDYFKSGPTRSWEPLLEPYKCSVLYEKSARRGRGMTYTSECPFHINITGAMLETLAFAFENFSYCTFKAFTKKDKSAVSGLNINGLVSSGAAFEKRTILDLTSSTAGIDEQNCNRRHLNEFEVTHVKSASLSMQDRVAFSLANLTGETIRYHQKVEESSTFIHYLDHFEAKALSFPATISIVRNMKVVEVPFEGIGNHKSNISSVSQVDSSHLVDIQVPGFTWVKGICIDTQGKRFVDLHPNSEIVKVRSYDKSLNTHIHAPAVNSSMISNHFIAVFFLLTVQNE